MFAVLSFWVMYLFVFVFFFFKQKTAYEMRISDWSSDVCCSDLSDSLRYALTLQAAETLLMAATAARSAEIALTAQDVAAFDDGSPVSRITSFIARDRFIITDQPANVAGEFRAP